MIEWEKEIIAYINSELSPDEAAELMEAIENDSGLQELLSLYQSIESDIANTDIEMPSNKMATKFNKHLESFQAKEKSTKFLSIKPLLKYAAISVVLLAATITLWNQLGTKTTSEQYAINAILSEMEHKSDTEKIKALYVNNKTSENNQSQIKQVLIESLQSDRSSNVRLASVETLTEYIDDDLVRSALIRSLGIEEDPQVQIAIIMALSESKNQEVIKPLEEIINKEGAYKFVKDEAHVGLMNVNSI